MDQGVLEKVFVLRNRKGRESVKVPCIRLVNLNTADTKDGDDVIMASAEEEGQRNIGLLNYILKTQVSL